MSLSEQDRERYGRACYDGYGVAPGTIGDPASWDETAKWPSERVPWINAAEAVITAYQQDRTALSLWLSPEDVDLLDVELRLLVNRAEPGTERHTRLVGIRNRLHWTEQDAQEVRQDQAAMVRLVGLAIDYRDAVRIAERSALANGRKGASDRAVQRVNAARAQAQRCHDLLLAGIDALDATEQGAGHE